jgi:tripartite-type tricarboxylate transporter receptor subunit TctC
MGIGRRGVLAIGAALPAAGLARAQTASYPNRPVRLIVPFAAGGPVDIVARLMAPVMTNVLGQSVVVEPRPGAGGMLGVDAVAKATPDGYMVGMASAGTLVLSPHLQRQMPYRTFEDLAPVTLAVVVNEPLVVPANAPWKSLAELIAAARAQPGRLTYGSSGPGSMPHLGAELFKLAAGGLDIVHVPYRGGGPVALALLAGEVSMGMPDLPAVLPHIRDGKLRALAMGTENRSPFLPEVPTFAEAGVPGVLTDNWHGVVLPARTPETVVAAVHRAVTAALADPETARQLRELGAIPMGGSREEFAAFMRREDARWSEVIRKAGATID